MDSNSALEQLIEAKLAKIATAEKSIEKLKIEIAALRQAREAIAETVAHVAERLGLPSLPSVQEHRKGRSLSAQWKGVLHDIAKVGSDGADLDQIEQFCRQRGIDQKRPTLRAQMSNYVARTYLGRTGDGKFFITLRGLQVAGLTPAEDSGAPVLADAPEEWK